MGEVEGKDRSIKRRRKEVKRWKIKKDRRGTEGETRTSIFAPLNMRGRTDENMEKVKEMH